MAGNSNLHMSRDAKEDEYYTDITLIEDELKHYKEHFRDKIIFCNCDDPYESNFFKYFAMNFNALGLKKLISLGYAGSPIVYQQLSLFDWIDSKTVIEERHPYKLEISEVTDENGDGAIDLADVELLIRNKKNVLTLLKGNGDFRSPESLSVLEEADIVVTNPPFSLMKEYIPLLMERKKKFLILGNMNHATFKEIFHYFMDDELWLGYKSGHFWFKVPEYYEEKKTDFKIDENGQKWRRLGNICWFTNLEIEKRHQIMVLYKHYTPEEYPKYDNYDAIEVSRTVDIPVDYDGIMGVPITFLDKYSPDQFEILGDSRFHDGQDFSDDINVINGKTLYRRLLVRKKGVGDGN